jgi:hypothetical protein
MRHSACSAKGTAVLMRMMQLITWLLLVVLSRVLETLWSGQSVADEQGLPTDKSCEGCMPRMTTYTHTTPTRMQCTTQPGTTAGDCLAWYLEMKSCALLVAMPRSFESAFAPVPYTTVKFTLFPCWRSSAGSGPRWSLSARQINIKTSLQAPKSSNM